MNPRSSFFWLAILALIVLVFIGAMGCATCRTPEERAASRGVVLECKVDFDGNPSCMVLTKDGVRTIKLNRCDVSY